MPLIESKLLGLANQYYAGIVKTQMGEDFVAEETEPEIHSRQVKALALATEQAMNQIIGIFEQKILDVREALFNLCRR